ncbi:hypothetical protein [Siphonobacter curvatus]|uniref:Uncharacterized protein n=1 Tax=Siphonobacter curvatus TaxID=2094562 RepID=A0A2S7IHM3_9BACT|nr:hypothetical protein [Siphonobacter curvatus]PQA55059.1 hypothetical protein C5O19_21180 [Siphonobacter curvatus]
MPVEDSLETPAGPISLHGFTELLSAMRKTTYIDSDALPVWLDETEKQDPRGFLESFWGGYEIPECRFLLWELLSGALKGNVDGYHCQAPASTLVYFFEQLCCHLEASHLLFAEKASAKGNQPNGSASLMEPSLEQPSTTPLSPAIHHPAFEDFFDLNYVADLRAELEDWLATAMATEEVCERPANLLFLHDQMLAFTKAAFELYEAQGLEAELLPSPTLNVSSALAVIETRLKQVEDFPLHLSPAEWQNPLLVIKECCERFDLEEWQILLHDLLRAALAKESFSTIVEPELILPFTQQLTRLLEACYLLFISQDNAV